MQYKSITARPSYRMEWKQTAVLIIVEWLSSFVVVYSGIYFFGFEEYCNATSIIWWDWDALNQMINYHTLGSYRCSPNWNAQNKKPFKFELFQLATGFVIHAIVIAILYNKVRKSSIDVNIFAVSGESNLKLPIINNSNSNNFLLNSAAFYEGSSACKLFLSSDFRPQ